MADEKKDKASVEKTPEPEKTQHQSAKAAAAEGVKELGKVAVRGLPFLADAAILAMHIMGNRDRAREIQALRSALGTNGGSSADDGNVSKGHIREMFEHVKQGNLQKAQEAGVKAGIFGLGEGDEGNIIWVTGEFYGFFLDQTPPRPEIATQFTLFMGGLSQADARRYRLAMGNIPGHKEQVQAQIRLARQIASVTEENAKKEFFEAFIRSVGVHHEPSAVLSGIAHGMEASIPAASGRVAEVKARLDRDINALNQGGQTNNPNNQAPVTQRRGRIFDI